MTAPSIDSSRLRAVFGAPLAEVTATHVGDLVPAGAREEADLDFKETLYGRSDSDKRDLAGDIAAMRNDRGGVILLGVKEKDGVAIATPEVEFSEGEELRMRQVVAELTAPHAEFEIRRLEGGFAGRGFYMLIAPPSSLRPTRCASTTRCATPAATAHPPAT
jgi:hypothetical protein